MYEYHFFFEDEGKQTYRKSLEWAELELKTE